MLENTNSALNEKIRMLESSNNSDDEKTKTLEKYLFALKEKPSDIQFYDANDYEDESIIGQGVTSDVKIAHKKTPEKYAKKELKLLDFETIKRFFSESEILFKLRHPCIVRIYGFSNGDDVHKPSIILSLEPTSLQSAIESGNLDEQQKCRIAVEIVLGMRYIHKHKFMHRDLKPSNILLSKKNHVRITDFGLAKEESLETSQSKGIGTLRFMAPELFEENGTNYTNKVDVYAFGIVLIFIITGKYPAFSFKNIGKGSLLKFDGKMAEWIHRLIANCLEIEAENRPSFNEIFEIMKLNNFDLFDDSKDKNLTNKQLSMKHSIESRIMKIEAFEFQHQNE